MKKDYFTECRRIMRDMLRESKVEYMRYKKGEGIIFLQQAGEKLFNAYQKYLEIKYQKKMFSHNVARNYASRNNSENYLMIIVDNLHRFYYHGESFEDTQSDNIENQYNTAYTKIQSKINNI